MNRQASGLGERGLLLAGKPVAPRMFLGTASLSIEDGALHTRAVK